MIRERKNCHLLLLPGSEPSHGTARLIPPCRPGAAMAPRPLHFAVSSRQTVELGRSRDAALFQRDLELPWRERFPTPDREHSKHVYENRGVPSRSLRDAFVFSCLPPALGSHVTLWMGSNQRKARPRGEDPSTQKSEPPLLLGGDKLRGAEKGAPASKVLQQRDAREVRLQGHVPCHARPGCQAGKCRTERKKKQQKNQQNKTKKIKHNRNKPNPRGMQHDNPKLEGPPGRRVEELGLQCNQQLSGHSSLHITLQF